MGPVGYKIMIGSHQPKHPIQNILSTSSKDHQVYLVFTSDSATYIFDTKKKKRHELANIHGKQYVDAGFTLNIKKQRFIKGEYLLGIIVAQNEKIVGFKFTKQRIEI